jgi:hypothetical protein
MILVAGIPSEPPVKMVIQAAEKAGIPCIVFNQRKAHLYELSLQFTNNDFYGLLHMDGQDYALSEISGLYVRMMDQHSLPELNNKVFNYIGESQGHKSLLLYKHFLQWMELATCRIFNKPSDMLSNLSKPYQCQMIAAEGFKVPPTCITTKVEEVMRFKAKYKSLIFKSISSARSIVKELGTEHFRQLHQLSHLPTQFQQKLNGFNIRVHVVGDVLFATKALSNIVDYRYSAREGEEVTMEAYQLPLGVENRCFAIAKSLNLLLCGIDLFLTDEGEYYCFEVNPSPGYSYYQQNTGQDIATAIAKWLQYGTSK